METFRGPLALPRRARDAHKAAVGRVLVVGGSVGMSGAPALAALGALRAGAGLVNVAVPSAVQPTVAAYRPEWMTTALGDDAATLDNEGVKHVLAMAPEWDTVVLGPGGGRKATLRLHRLAIELPVPVVLDADALFGWGLFGDETKIDALKDRQAVTVLTPHEGEAARMLNTTPAEVREHRNAGVEALANQTGGIVVLKGPQTLVCDGSRLYRNDSGNPILATGGTGDVLAGMCGALIAFAIRAGSDIFAAVCTAVHAHGLAGDELAGLRDRGVLASEIADAVPDALASLLQEPTA